MPIPDNRQPEPLPSSMERRWLIAIGLLALILRLAMACQPGFYHPDEMWQYIEPAYGWVTGHWVQTWEFHVGLRGWLLPALYVPVLALGELIAPATQFGQVLLRLLVALVSLVVPWCFWRLGRKISPVHGLVAALVGAIWPELVYFAPHPGGENMAIIAVFASLALTFAQGPREPSRLSLAGAGMLLALAACIRFQYLPAVGLIGLALMWPAPRRVLPLLLAGGLAGLALAGAADAAAGRMPLTWLITNFNANLTQGRSQFFGAEPAWWYFRQIVLTWSWGGLLLVPALYFGMRRLPLLAAVAAVTLVSHSLIAHKEYRFILLAVQLMVLLTAIGSVDLLQTAARHWPPLTRFQRERVMMPLLAAIWFVAMVLTAISSPFIDNWGNGRLLSQTLAKVGADPKLCGIAAYQRLNHPAMSYALLGRNVPMYSIEGPQAAQLAAANQSRFNYVLTQTRPGRTLPPSYRLIGCAQPGKPADQQNYCIYRRPGRCSPGGEDLEYGLAIWRQGS